MNDTDKRKPTSERLSEAGKAARDYLKSLKVDLNASNPTRAPSGDSYVEGPSGNRTPVLTPNPKQDEDDEAELVSYINERNKDMASHFGSVEKK